MRAPNTISAREVTDPVKAAHEMQNWQGDLYKFGLVEHEQVDCFLATAFGKSERTLVAR